MLVFLLFTLNHNLTLLPYAWEDIFRFYEYGSLTRNIRAPYIPFQSHHHADFHRFTVTQMGRNSSRVFDVTRESPVPAHLRHSIVYKLCTTDSTLFSGPRRLPLEWQQVTHYEFDYMLGKGICCPLASAWASPLLLVAKKYGSCRYLVVTIVV